MDGRMSRDDSIWAERTPRRTPPGAARESAKKRTLKMAGAIAGTAMFVSGVWALFFVRVTQLKDEQIAGLRLENERLAQSTRNLDALKRVENRLAGIDRRIVPLALAVAMDPLSGRITSGSGTESTTVVTALLIEAQDLVRERKFDLAEKKTQEIEALYPGFLGVRYLRYGIAVERGNSDTAFSLATNLIAALPSDNRVLPMYGFAISYLLQQGRKKQAEDLCLAAMKLDSTNQNWRVFFQQNFGREPPMTATPVGSGP